MSYTLREYPSAYQPPPFNTNAPDTINRLAVRFPHDGHFLIGGSVIRCSVSNVLEHEVQV
jgi:hypothetical protein